MGVQKLIDKNFPTHGNWRGQSLGTVAVIWLTHILSQADHRLNQVQAWAGKQLETLKKWHQWGQEPILYQGEIFISVFLFYLGFPLLFILSLVVNLLLLSRILLTLAKMAEPGVITQNL